MINFTLGPVSMYESTLELGKMQPPYFRTQEFSNIMIENELIMSELLSAPYPSRTVFLTCSGTGAMEATVSNVLNKNDNVLIVNGGSFGQRFVDLCNLYNIKNTEINVEYGQQITIENLNQIDLTQQYTALLINMCETSTGVLYDMPLISKFCIENNLLLIIDSISCFLATNIAMNDLKADVLINSSQKALACPAGVAMITLSEKALSRIDDNVVQNMYFSLKRALYNKNKGQTPWTPAVTTMLQINDRLKDIQKNGLTNVINDIQQKANYFRQNISHLSMSIATSSNALSNSLTALHCEYKKSYDIYTELRDIYHIYVCPTDIIDVIRVGHLGNLLYEDYDKLITALYKIV